LRRATSIGLLAVLGCLACAAWLTFNSDDNVTNATTDTPGAEYSQLKVTEGDIGWFQGSITVTNNEAADRRAFVTVNLYDGDENVGELRGDAVLKPKSKASVESSSIDHFAGYDEARVEVHFFGP
jgi:hypothetical protein